MRSSWVPRITHWICTAGALTCATAASAPASAQQVALDRFDPAPAGDRMFAVESPYVAGWATPHAAVLADYAHNPFTLKHGPGQVDVGSVVGDQMFLHLDVSVALFRRVNLNVSLPIALLQDGTDPTLGGVSYRSPHGAGVGDVRLGARGRLYGEYDAPFQLAVSGYVWAPSGADNVYLSDGKVRGAASVILGGHVPAFNWSFSAGLQFRRTQTIQAGDVSLTQGTNAQIGGGIGFLFADGKAQIGPEVKGSVLTAGATLHNTNAELLLDARYRLFHHFEVGLGAGPGLSSGFGTPDVRVVGMIAFTPEQKKAAPPDRDHDGVPDAEDACPDVAAPRSANPQRPGCPPIADRDRDGVPDAEDACPDIAGVSSADPGKNGCPSDRDGDGIPDAKDACPGEPGPLRPDPARNGCPMPADADGDGIPDAEDACPGAPGIKSTDPRLNGCPGDRDGDGVRDDLDACPDVPGRASKHPERNGCPRTRVTDKGIDILEQVEFATDTAKIQPVSLSLIEEVAGILQKHADIARVEVQGHTDDQGSRAQNRLLSQQRADAVKKALVADGVAAKRLVAKGYGPDKPIADNATEEGRAKNRRVQFVILQHAAPRAAARPKAPPRRPARGPKAPSPKK